MTQNDPGFGLVPTWSINPPKFSRDLQPLTQISAAKSTRRQKNKTADETTDVNEVLQLNRRFAFLRPSPHNFLTVSRLSCIASCMKGRSQKGDGIKPSAECHWRVVHYADTVYPIPFRSWKRTRRALKHWPRACKLRERTSTRVALALNFKAPQSRATCFEKTKLKAETPFVDISNTRCREKRNKNNSFQPQSQKTEKPVKQETPSRKWLIEHLPTGTLLIVWDEPDTTLKHWSCRKKGRAYVSSYTVSHTRHLPSRRYITSS